MRKIFGMMLAGAAGLTAATTVTADTRLEAVIAGEHRTPAYVDRDAYRRPLQTLRFFGLEPQMTVVELWPGGGWYTEILAPYLRGQGKLYAAHFNPEAEREYFRRSLKNFRAKLAAAPQLYDEVEVTAFDPPELLDIAPPGSADMVLTFRNVHNWYMRGEAEGLSAAFAAMYRALRPGGILGVVDHRLPPERPSSAQKDSGYMREDVVVDLAQQAGFRLLASSELNANPLDTADHPKGVWTLPPSLRLGEQDLARYLTIGESDRMTLKFIKPLNGPAYAGR